MLGVLGVLRGCYGCYGRERRGPGHGRGHGHGCRMRVNIEMESSRVESSRGLELSGARRAHVCMRARRLVRLERVCARANRSRGLRFGAVRPRAPQGVEARARATSASPGTASPALWEQRREGHRGNRIRRGDRRGGKREEKKREGRREEKRSLVRAATRTAGCQDPKDQGSVDDTPYAAPARVSTQYSAPVRRILILISE